MLKNILLILSITFSCQGNPGADGTPGVKGAPVSLFHRMFLSGSKD